MACGAATTTPTPPSQPIPTRVPRSPTCAIISGYSIQSQEAQGNTAKADAAADAAIRGNDPLGRKPEHLRLTAEQRAELAAKRAREALQRQEDKARESVKLGSLSSSSVRSYENMARVLDPRPNARARWQRNMLIRHVRRGGRLTKEMAIARTERQHVVRSHWFKTSMKKLAPLCRQISGKPVDEAILQMRFSKKAVAQDVLQHLIQARDEAIAVKGMVLPPPGPVVLDPSISPATANQKPNKKSRDGSKAETDIYIAQAWVNRGPYGKRPEYRARGRVNILRPPHTGMTVLLKEEKTRTREQREREDKVIRKRLGKNMWTQLPDRPITSQSQYVLW
ncbi:hypothetical protein DV735_g313, partial [Chaetothyriales sp. CBS 134920]